MTWFHERTELGWDVRDEKNELIAQVPDLAHEHEADAVQIASTANRADHYGQLKRGVDGLVRRLEQDADSRRSVIRDLVERIASDVRVMQAQLKERGPDVVTSTWIAAHVRELVEAQADLDTMRRQIASLRAKTEDDA